MAPGSEGGGGLTLLLVNNFFLFNSLLPAALGPIHTFLRQAKKNRHRN